MIDYSPIEVHIRRAKLQRSAAMGEVVADGVLAVWSGLKRAIAWVARQGRRIGEPPREYTTALPRQF